MGSRFAASNLSDLVLDKRWVMNTLPGMDVRQAQAAADPGYPERKEFQQYRHLLGATVLGAGMVVSACTGKTGGVVRTSGVPPINPADSRPATKPQAKQAIEAPGHLAGRIQVEPSKLEPPARLAGDVMVMPKPDAPEDKPAATPGVPASPGR